MEARVGTPCGRAARRYGRATPGGSVSTDYAAAFDEVIRGMRRQGFFVNDKVIEKANARASEKAATQAQLRGHRQPNVRTLNQAGLAAARARWGA